MKSALCTILGISLMLFSCSREKKSPSEDFAFLLKGSPHIEGKQNYLSSPFVTAGDRAYLVGHQDGSFPDLGWHIKGEMGGIWAHPIKLLDGFSVFLRSNDRTYILGPNRAGTRGIPADRFTNYPVANQHRWSLDSLGIEVARWQFIPDGKQGVVVEFDIRNRTQDAIAFEFEFFGHADLRPTWLGEKTGMVDGKDLAQYDSVTHAWTVKDTDNPWWVRFGSDLTPIRTDRSKPFYLGSGTSSSLIYFLDLQPGMTQTLRFAIAGSSTSGAEVKNTYNNLLEHAEKLLVEKRDRFAALAEKSKLTIPDTALQQAFEWLKYNSDWMIQEVPGIGRGITAGIPDYPWWFGVDSEYALRGYMAVGQTDIVFETIRLLDSVSMAVNGNGRILHEMSTNGAVFNPGNINETPQFASLIWHVYRWSGDEDFLRRYFPTVRKGLKWLMETKDSNENGFPDGFGMMEIHGLDSEMIDVASYTQEAFYHASLMAQALGEEEWALEYASTAENLKKKINDEFWSDPFSSYADFMGTDQQALRLIEDAIVRADTLNKPWAVAELEQTRASIRANPKTGLRPFVLHHNWVVNTPMEVGIADTAKALRALETARKFINPYGVFVTGIDRDASAGEDAGSFAGSKVFSYTGAVMTLPTGVQAIAENNYGRPDQALDYLQRMTRSFSYALPGSMYEVSPDYGMMAQAWNIFSFAVPVVEQFFGIDPMAAQKKVRISPLMPTAWNRASLENVQIGSNEISVFFSRTADGRVHLRVVQKTPGWTLLAPAPLAADGTMELISGEMRSDANGQTEIISTGSELEFSYSPGPE